MNPIQGNVPSRQTLFRIRIVDDQAYSLVRQGIARLKPLLWLRDSGKVRRIEGAQTLEEVLDLVPLASGLGELAWHEQMRKFGPEALPSIAAWLGQMREIQDPKVRERCTAHLIAELRWRGEAGAQAILECFNDLDNLGKSLACVVLGLAEAQTAAGRMWEMYQQTVQDEQESYFVGALWGLLDLGDEHATAALAELCAGQYDFFELYGFLARGGDARAVIPLLNLAAALPKQDRLNPMMALLGIAHRIGREALAAEIEKAAEGEESRREYEALADLVLSKPASLCEEYFAIFYRGFKPEDVARALDELSS